MGSRTQWSRASTGVGYDTPADVSSGEPSNSDYGLVLSSLPSVSLRKSELANLTVPQRVGAIAKAVVATSSSGLVRGAVMRQALDFFARSVLGVRSRTGLAYVQAAKRAIDVITLDATMRGLVEIQDDANEDKHPTARITAEIVRYLVSRWKLQASMYPIEFTKHAGWYHENGIVVDMKQLVDTLCDLDSGVATTHGIVVVSTESFKHDDLTYTFILCRINGEDFAIFTHVPTESAYDTGRQTTLFSPSEKSHFQYKLMQILDAAVKENFIARVNPAKNVIQLSDLSVRNCLVAVPRRATHKAIYNVDVDDIAVSISYALRNKVRHVVALVGDGGLGKTEAIHHLVNQFPEIPALFVSAGAFGAEPSAETVQTIFRIAAATKSMLVLEDFDGLNVKNKTPYVVELLRQLSGEGDFHGVALITINEPQSVASTLLDRPGRIDEVHLVDYLTADHVNALLLDCYGVVMPEKDVARIVELRFSIARIRSAFDRAVVRGFIRDREIVDLDAVRSCIDVVQTYAKNASLISVRGRLQETDDVPDDGKNEPCTSTTGGPVYSPGPFQRS